MSRLARTDFTGVTETAGNLVQRLAIDMLRTRYEFAARRSEGRDVLEVGCGPGPGLGYLASRARRVVGGDYSADLIGIARRHYGTRIPVLQLDAEALPFHDGSFDVVLMFEALYYLPDQARFIAEARRVLRPGGELIIVAVNPAWPDFNPSPYSTRYLDAPELRMLMESGRFETTMAGAFGSDGSASGALVSAIKRVAAKLNVIPKTMTGKELLKRVFYGRLEPFPSELTDRIGMFHEPQSVDARSAAVPYKVLFAVGARR